MEMGVHGSLVVSVLDHQSSGTGFKFKVVFPYEAKHSFLQNNRAEANLSIKALV